MFINITYWFTDSLVRLARWFLTPSNDLLAEWFVFCLLLSKADDGQIFYRANFPRTPSGDTTPAIVSVWKHKFRGNLRQKTHNFPGTRAASIIKWFTDGIASGWMPREQRVERDSSSRCNDEDGNSPFMKYTTDGSRTSDFGLALE